MRSNLTDITVVMDRSGSMADCLSDAEGGINTFIEKQKTEVGEAIFTLVQFDNEYEFVHKGIPIKDVPPFKLHPRGGTALLDAVGRAINETGSRIGLMNEADRPGLVVFVIVTDGHENASHEFTKDKIKEIIEHQTNTYKWQFTFLGANQDAFAAGGGIGVAQGACLNYVGAQSVNAFTAASNNVGRMRVCMEDGRLMENKYSDEEIKSSV